MSITKRQAPYRHSDGTNCYTKNCSIGNTKAFVDAQASLKKAETFEDYAAAKDKMKVTQRRLTVEQLQQKIVKENDGLILYLYHEDGNIELDTIQVPKELRNTGIGTRIMREITDYADLNQKTISLTPSSDLGSSYPRLEIFYRRHGFTKNLKNNRKSNMEDTMIRYPA